MCNIHSLKIIPNQESINSIAFYSTEFDNNELDYTQLLERLKNIILELHFMEDQDTSEWMQTRGNDYLSNPKLFCHAPLTCLCAFLGYLFNTYNLEELQAKLPPEILECALTRFSQFKAS